MNKFVFKNYIVNIVLGSALMIFAVLAMFVFDWIGDFVNIVVAIIIAYYSIVRFIKEQEKYKNSNALMILGVELGVALVLGVLLVINEIDIYFAIGLVLYLRGFTYLLILQLLKLRTKFYHFLISMAVLTLGTYIFFVRPDIDTLIQFAVFIFLLTYGILLLVFGLRQIKKPKGGTNE